VEAAIPKAVVGLQDNDPYFPKPCTEGDRGSNVVGVVQQSISTGQWDV